MKVFSFFATLLWLIQSLSAQNQGTGPVINKNLTNYFSQQQLEKVFVATDQSHYHPGETVWFKVFVTDGNIPASAGQSKELFVKLYDSKGKSESQQLFKLSNGTASCDLYLQKNIKPGIYFLCAYTSNQLQNASIQVLKIDSEYSNQWITEIKARDSISVSGIRNEMIITLKELTGEIQKNTSLQYKILNGTEIIDQGKLKTDKLGKTTLPFTLPSKSNGDPFTCLLSGNKEGWESSFFLPSNLDPIEIRFFPEGGTLIPGSVSKIGFTAFNRWGIPVNVEGAIQNQDGSTIATVKTFSAGLGLFSLTTEGNQNYKLLLSSRIGQNQSYALPKANPAGMTLTVVKGDPDFITCNLLLADQRKQTIALTVSQGSNLNWIANLEIDKNAKIKIPIQNIPQGIHLLSVFGQNGEPLTDRLVYIDKKEQFKIALLPEKNSLAVGEKMTVKVLLTNESNLPMPGNLTISITDKYRLRDFNPLPIETSQMTSDLETPFSLISDALAGKNTTSSLLDLFLISNRLKNPKWDRTTVNASHNNLGSSTQMTETSNPKNDSNLSEYIADYALKYTLLYQPRPVDLTYLSKNEDLFQKAPKVFKANTIALDNQRRMFESASSILDVIKSIKPYKITNNQIVFLGSENSFNYQGGALIVLDGQQMGTDISALSSISPMEVDHINISTNPMEIQRYTGLNSVGIIEIFQKRAVVKTEETKSEQVEKYENGYRVTSNFPSAPNNAKHDQRTTLLWIPNLKTDQTGRSEFSFTAGSISSEFVIKAVGITENGLFGTGQVSFVVTK